MGTHRQVIILVLSYFLMSSCLCSPPTRSRRQKRGLVKMMMHIMWDPVRLIRYWYAYDVTKEIAKSWRKIIPTILLLPITQRMPHSHGFAKYVNPTYGVRDSSKKKTYSKYYNSPVGQHYYKSAGHVKPVAMPPEVLHEILPSRYAYSPQQSPHYYSRNADTNKDVQYKDRGVPKVLVGHVPFSDSKENDNPYSVAHYFVGDDYSKDHVSTSGEDIFFPEQTDHGTYDYISSSSSQNMPSRNFNKRPIQKFSQLTQKDHIHYIPHAQVSVDQEEREKEASHILHPGQEFHIVLHPIPVGDFNPNSLEPPSDGHGIQFIPVHPSINESYGSASPLLFRAVTTNSAESSVSQQEYAIDSTATDDPNNVELITESDENMKSAENNSSANEKSRVTWIANPSRRKDQEVKDLQSDGTVARVSSIHTTDIGKYKLRENGSHESNHKAKSNGLYRHSINMERLREDLKHGTPVLIPFNKTAHYPKYTSKNAPGRFQQTNNQRIVLDKVNTMPSKDQIDGVVTVNSSDEQSFERNSTQRFVLFLKKEKHL